MKPFRTQFANCFIMIPQMFRTSPNNTEICPLQHYLLLASFHYCPKSFYRPDRPPDLIVPATVVECNPVLSFSTSLSLFSLCTCHLKIAVENITALVGLIKNQTLLSICHIMKYGRKVQYTLDSGFLKS